VFGSSKTWWENLKKLTEPQTKPASNSRPFIDEQWMNWGEFVEHQIDYYLSLGKDVEISVPKMSPTGRSLPSLDIGLVKCKLKQINTRKATHLNDFPSWISKSNAEDICIPLTDIINTIMKTATFPRLWKTADICPLKKVPTRTEYKDFRPISLTWHCGKIAESFMVNILNEAVLPKLERNQFAYTPKVGTTDALVMALNTWAKSLDCSDTLAIQTLFMDFSKAFDLLRPDILVAKLQGLNIEPAIVQLSHSFMTDRQQRVINRQTSSMSALKPAKLGVPQGTLCGPIFWNIFINDLQPAPMTVKYADDVTCSITINKSTSSSTRTGTRDINVAIEENVTQEIANNSERWCRVNHMRLNELKTKAMNISLRDGVTVENGDVVIKGSVIESVRSFKLLGVHLDQHLTFKEHVNIICQKARRQAYALLLLKRNGVAVDGLVRFYAANIRSILSYAAPAWYPFASRKLKDDIESTQKHCLKIILPFEASYTNRLCSTGLPSLDEFIETLCRSFCSKVVRNPHHVLNGLVPPRQSTRRHSSRLDDRVITSSRTSLLSKSLFYQYT
jgi:hypothetical protein